VYAQCTITLKVFFIVFVVLPLSMTMADVLGQYSVNNFLMATFSGSARSPGRALLSNALQIAPAHPHGHRNGQQT